MDKIITVRQVEFVNEVGEIVINENRINLTAHAGCMGTKMDSIESVETGIKYGADIIEIDLNIDERGMFVLSHDRPKTGGKYPVLEEVLKIIKSEENVILNIDIKNIKALSRLNRIVLEYGINHRIFLTGIDFKNLVRNKEILKESNYFINLDESKLDKTKLKDKNYLEQLFNELRKLNIMGININYKFVTPEIINICKEKKILSSVWTVDDVEEMKKLINLKVNSITTKEVKLLWDLVNKDGGNLNGRIKS